MKYLTAGVWVIATGVIIYGLYIGRDILAPFALAVFLWLVIEGFARLMKTRIPAMPEWLTQVLAVLVIIGASIGVAVIFVDGLNEFVRNSRDYEARIDAIIRDAYSRFNLIHGDIDPPTLSGLVFNQSNTRFVQPILDAVQGLTSSFVLIMIYIAFLFMAQSAWSGKLDAVFTDSKAREQASEVTAAVRKSMEQYLWVQTVVSIVITLLTYVTMLALGLDNALFWAFVVFFLNYIPTIGSIVAAFLPGFFALAQPDWPAYMPADPTINAIIVLASVSAWQFAIGNFLQPRLMGETLNLSALVVLVSLSVWGALWGLPGMFLSAPLTVLMMILLAQTPGGRWIAVILSADGHPVKPVFQPSDSTPTQPAPNESAETAKTD